MITSQYLTRSHQPEFAPFVIAHEAQVYHLAKAGQGGGYDRLSLCGQVEQHPTGGQYRSGHKRPTGAYTTPRSFRCCSVCATIAQTQDEAELSGPAKLLAHLLGMAGGLTEDRLWSAASYAGADWQMIAGREAAKLELERRLREQVGRREVAA